MSETPANKPNRIGESDKWETFPPVIGAPEPAEEEETVEEPPKRREPAKGELGHSERESYPPVITNTEPPDDGT